MNEHKQVILEKLDRRTLYEQLAEECSELAQASLYEAHANLFDEIVDVLIVLNCLGIKEQAPATSTILQNGNAGRKG